MDFFSEKSKPTYHNNYIKINDFNSHTKKLKYLVI